MHNKFPHWLEVTTLVVLVLNAPVVFLEFFPSLLPGLPINTLEWGFTIVFTLEYFTRIALAHSKRGYILSLDGILDLLATLPQYLLLFVSEGAGLFLVRILRFVRLIARRWRAMREIQELRHGA